MTEEELVEVYTRCVVCCAELSDAECESVWNACEACLDAKRAAVGPRSGWALLNTSPIPWEEWK